MMYVKYDVYLILLIIFILHCLRVIYFFLSSSEKIVFLNRLYYLKILRKRLQMEK